MACRLEPIPARATRLSRNRREVPLPLQAAAGAPTEAGIHDRGVLSGWPVCPEGTIAAAAGPPTCEVGMILILGDTNLCPRACQYFRTESSDKLIEECHLPDGNWSLRIKDGELTECPLGRWDLKVEMGVSPPIE
jgi:hypothetical protein